MTLIKATDTGATDECVELAERHLMEALRAVAEITDKIRRQELGELPDLAKAAANASAATRQLLTEKNRVYEQQKRTVGIARDYAIDFDAARAEIGRRMARLRAAGGS